MPLGAARVIENSANNAWNWNYNNQAWNNNNKNNTNSLVAARNWRDDKEKMKMKYNVKLEDMYKAYRDCRKRKRNTAGAKQFELYAMFNLIKLVIEINSGKYKLKPSSCFVVLYPKAREVFCAAFRDRIVQHFVYNELNPVIEKMLINNTMSCRKKKGTDKAIRAVARNLRRVTNNYSTKAFCEKLDLSGFFMNIDREILLEIVLDVIWNHYKGPYKEVLDYLVRIIILTDITKDAVRICNKKKWDIIPPNKTLFNNKYGIAIGNITSQLFANLYLNNFDHFMKSRHKHYVRYVDDIVIHDESKDRLYETRDMADEFLDKYHQKLNSNKTIINPADYGVAFLGIKIMPHYNCLYKSRINRLYYTSRKLSSREALIKSAASRRGMFRRYKGYNVSRRWFNSIPEELKEDIKFTSDYKVVDFRKEKSAELIKIKYGGYDYV